MYGISRNAGVGLVVSGQWSITTDYFKESEVNQQSHTG